METNKGPSLHVSALQSVTGEEGEVLMTTTIRPRHPPRRYRLRLQWQPKMIQRNGRDDDGTIDGSESSQQSTNDAKSRGGGG